MSSAFETLMSSNFHHLLKQKIDSIFLIVSANKDFSLKRPISFVPLYKYLQKNSTVAILGTTGAGKSSLVRQIMGLQRAIETGMLDPERWKKYCELKR
jgi:ABC-type transport system involved in cytochrome bd biosynthesis fused ATPase/permease subunit